VRALATVVAVAAVAVLAAHAAATTTRVPTVPCRDVIGQAKTGRGGGYRLVLGVVSAPPARLTQVVATGEQPWSYWRKAGLVVRAGRSAVGVTVPKAWRSRAAVMWGSSGPVSALKIAGCPSPPGVWNAYAGGFLLRTRPQCVPLTFTVAGRSKTVRFGVGGACR
jgi:hypothetical protein